MSYNFKTEVMRWNNKIYAPFIKYLISAGGSFLTTQPMGLQYPSQRLERLVYISIPATIWQIKGPFIFLTQEPTYLETLQLLSVILALRIMLIFKLPVILLITSNQIAIAQSVCGRSSCEVNRGHTDGWGPLLLSTDSLFKSTLSINIKGNTKRPIHM